jgi:manganese/iron transport system substrate-binding protein
MNTTVTQATRMGRNLPLVVVTTSVLCDLTKQVAEQNINLVCLIPFNIAPDSYRPNHQDIQSLKAADLILYQGYNLESRLIKTIKTIKTPAPKIAVSQRAVPHPQKLQLNGKKFIEPHIWHNAKNTIRMVQIIGSSLSRLTPKNAKVYHQNSLQIIAELNQLHNWIKSRIASIPNNKRQLYTFHDAMVYYVKAYGLDYSTLNQAIAIKTPNSTNKIPANQVSILFDDIDAKPNLLKHIAREANAKIFPRPLYISNLGAPGSDGETYQKMMDTNTRNIVEGLGGTYLKFQPTVFRPTN